MNRTAVLAVTDGLGFNRERSRKIINEAWDRLPKNDRGCIAGAANGVGRDLKWASNILYPVNAESLAPETPTDKAVSWLSDLHSAKKMLDVQIIERIATLVEVLADEHRYVPWTSGSRELWRLRNTNLSLPTSASGIWAGFEDLNPAVQGNSETGHEQIANTRLAPQLSLEITRSIETGDFFNNPALNTVISEAKSRGANVNFCFLLSGAAGGDGRVHSAWNHLEAFCELIFDRHKMAAQQVQMQAILDGRDSAVHSSTVSHNGSGDFLGGLRKLLGLHNAEGSLAWVIGRSMAMDRDYREEAAKTDFNLMTGRIGRPVTGFDEAIKAINAAHLEGKTDQDVPPISILRIDGSRPSISNGDAFVNLNFRSDRQRSKIGFLAGARRFLATEGESRGRKWDGSWIDHGMNLDICALAEYHPVFESDYGVRVAFHSRPHSDNVLAKWRERAGSDQYTLIAESVKASHMGYFFRGRRENPVHRANEIRVIIPSHGEEDGIKSDTEFYRHPEMRTDEITKSVLSAIDARNSRLICCNIAAPDMIGHLLPDRYQEAKVAHRAAANALVRMTNRAHASGRYMVITSDHGNIEDNTSAHSVNDILTTIIAPGHEILDPAIPVFQARLFDIAPTLLKLLGSTVNQSTITIIDPFIGRSLVHIEP